MFIAGVSNCVPTDFKYKIFYGIAPCLPSQWIIEIQKQFFLDYILFK